MEASSPDSKRRKKDQGEDAFSVSFDFTRAEVLDPSLSWKNEPASTSLEGGCGLVVTPKPQTDFWRKTFLTPTPADSASGHALLYSIPGEMEEVTAETVFTLEHKVQYDQAGLMVYVDDEHWLKAGIELEGGCPNMSCVITNGESDWNYVTWPTAENIHLRVNIHRYSLACECRVEYIDEKGAWCLLREGPIALSSEGAEVSAGVMCCAPKKDKDDDGMKAIFKSLDLNGQ